MTAALDVAGVRVRLRDADVLAGLGLTLAPGQVRALVGLNGAGKTTALRVILGMLRPDAGRVLLLGHELGGEPRDVWGRVGHLVESPSAYPELTARENIAATTAMHGADPLRAARRASELAETLGLGPWLDTRVGRLSLGTRQRRRRVRARGLAALGRPGALGHAREPGAGGPAGFPARGGRSRGARHRARLGPSPARPGVTGTPSGPWKDGRVDNSIRVRGAHLHNLADVDVDLPRNALVAFTGVSGSGKSSLAFGTIQGEAQRRYFESVAPFARRLMQQASSPQVRSIEGLPPAVALQQRHSTNARSSVGTITQTSNTLRMLWSRCGDYPEGMARVDSDHFSPNTAVGACPECSGLGSVHRPTEASMVPDPDLSIADGAIASWPGAWLGKNYRDILRTLGYDIHVPWRTLPQDQRDWILFTDEEPIVTVHPERAAGRVQRPYQGQYRSAARHVLHVLSESKSAPARERALRFVITSPCPTCHGRRLNPDALRVTWSGLAIDEATALPIDALLPRLRERRVTLGDPRQLGATAQAEAMLLDDLVSRLGVLAELGLGHLALGRATPTVSAGELQRLRLATLLRSGLFGVVYVLDEPSAGLHPRDVEPLMTVLRRLVEAGNSVLVVEHDLDIVRACDWVVDVGPGAGSHGGHVLYSGPVPGLRDVGASVTRRYLDRTVHPEEIRDDAGRDPRGTLRLSGVTVHNLRHLDVEFGLGVVTVVTGVSGSGKTSLLTATGRAVGVLLGQDPAARDDGGDAEPDDLDGVGQDEASWGTATMTGPRRPDRVVQITQKPIGRTPRSNLATYTGLFDRVRKLFADTPRARELGHTPSRFSFNVAEGRCPTCSGEGVVAVELLFMPGTYSVCPDCGGTRYNDDTLRVRWHDLTIADVLALTVEDAVPVFADEPVVARALAALDALGLGYLTLGQPATELSGGEAQRIKLASELQRKRRGHTLYLLDEPSAGLHPADVHLLLHQLDGLAAAGNTVIMVEHDAAAIATADEVVELGPGAGEAGGRIVGRRRNRAADAAGRPHAADDDRTR
ncbi:ATP-binding cassette domain-containing protein [Nigerium massiliense]|uniref:ATP-binding cassette domain-containing protein n=1 Tax=Nigerium massiliense TaxID=1522317 RepID=UPI000ADF70C4|nr:ATP-binding cassette domain-containing protein [Nigerium massiliense]